MHHSTLHPGSATRHNGRHDPRRPSSPAGIRHNMSLSDNYPHQFRASSTWLRKYSMRKQLVGAMLILSCAGTLGMAIVAIVSIYAAAEVAGEQRVRALADIATARIQTWLDGERTTLASEAEFEHMAEVLSPQPSRPVEGWNKYFTKLANQHKLRDLLIIRADGTVAYSQAKSIDAGTGISFSQYVQTYGELDNVVQKALRIARTTNGAPPVVMSDLWLTRLFGGSGGVWMMASPVIPASGKPLGVVVFVYDSDTVTQLLTTGGNYDALNLGAAGDIFVRGADGKLKSSARFLSMGKGRQQTITSTFLESGERPGERAREYVGAGQRDVVGLSRKVELGPDSNFVQVELDSIDVYGTARYMSWCILLFCALSISGSLVFAWWFSGTVAGTLRAAMAGLEGISGSARRTSQGFEEASERLSSACMQQAASLQQISSSHEEMTAMSRQNAIGAKKAADLTREARETVKHVADDIARMIAAVEAIRSSSQESMKVVRSIDEVAFRTKLIALNAAIEAARAEGQTGAAFSVVADEVRRLAQSSADAARGSSERMEAVVQDAVRAATLTDNVSQDLTTIVRQVEDIDLLSEEIAHSSQEQAVGFEQISRAVVEIDRVTQTAAAASSESAQAGRSLRENAADLGVTVQQLRILVEGTDSPEARREAVAPGEPDEAGIVSF
ncbi:hypothetical protein DB346_04200 [Verrucomicrobia bacterium LW23]|nr:hypothetical protein DB346_04200 [Verrucomicrobia bacterium LW23]